VGTNYNCSWLARADTLLKSGSSLKETPESRELLASLSLATSNSNFIPRFPRAPNSSGDRDKMTRLENEVTREQKKVKFPWIQSLKEVL
jgi:hypothetical protein